MYMPMPYPVFAAGSDPHQSANLAANDFAVIPTDKIFQLFPPG